MALGTKAPFVVLLPSAQYHTQHRWPQFLVLTSLGDRRWCPHFASEEADARRVSALRVPERQGGQQQAGTQGPKEHIPCA